MSIIFKIARWSQIFENNRTRELKSLSWVPTPNSHDGHGYALLLAKKNGPALYGAWNAILQVASRCDPRGTLLRDGKRAHNAASLAIMTRFPVKLIEECLKVCSDPEIGWLLCENTNESDIPATECDIPACDCENPATGCLEGKGRERREGKEETPPPPFYPEARIALHWLNEKSGSHFREVDANLSIIAARIESTGGDLDGVKAMISRQCLLWKPDPKMAEFLRPSTLFGVHNFEKYYGMRLASLPGTHTPAPRRDDSAHIDHNCVQSPV